jgi:OOP family OmpA-OmpF porin
LDCSSLEKRRSKEKKMKKITISIIALMALSSQSYAGGDILPKEEYEAEIVVAEVEPFIEEVKIEVVKPVVKEVKAEVIVPLVKEHSGWYAGAGLVAGRTSTVHCEDITYGVMAKVGYDFNEYVGVEARGVRTNWEYEGSKIKHVGAFIKPQYPASEDVNVYGLVGYGKTTTSHIQNIDETGLAYGAGVEYALSEDMNLFVDYERLLEKSDVPDLDALSLGVSFSF